MLKRGLLLVMAGAIVFSLYACSSPEGKAEQNIADDGISGIKPPNGCEIIGNTEDFEPVKDEQSYNKNTDAPLCENYWSITIADEALYLNDGDLLIYYDKNTGNSNLLCDKPDCNHLSTKCNGRIMSSIGIQYYEGYLYTVTGYWQLQKISCDGTVREGLGMLTPINFDGGSIRWIIHRGYIYYWYACSGTSEESSFYLSGSNCIYRKALEKDSEPECIMALPQTDGTAYFIFKCIGSYVYIQTEKGLYRYNTESNKVEYLDTINEMHGIAVIENKIYYAQYDENKKITTIYNYLAETNEQNILWEEDGEIFLSGCDNEFFYIGYEYTENVWKTEIRNPQGEYVAEIPNWEEADGKVRMWRDY